MAASIVIGATSQATAASYYWNDSEPGLLRPTRPILQRRQHGRHNPDKATRAAEKEAAKPQGPLILVVSVNKQQVKVYDANGLFTEAPVSTGMAGHATPMGVFSVIQKQKFHRSNIYSGAPMPFMQRITWSGIALHAGVLPGYPASHGCIRMPPGFAVKMYGWTRMGARVLVTPGEASPSSFEHPLLAAFKAPQPAAATQPDTNAPAASKADKGADAGEPATTGSNLELRASIDHDDGIKPAADIASAPLRGQTHTADAGEATGDVITVSDAAPDSTAAAPGPEASAEDRKAETASAPKSDAAEGKAESRTESKSDSKPDETAADVPTKPGTPVRSEATEKAAATPADGAAKSDATSPADLQTAIGKPVDAKPSTEKAAADKPEGTAKAAETKPADINPADTKPADAKDPARLTDADKPAPQKPELKHNSQIAIFISRKDSKLYVRQNFAPVFSTPVTIAPSDRPLGTHVFTAATDKTDPGVLHWSVISLPASSRRLTQTDERGSRRSRKGREAEIKVAPAPDSPAEALDRITISPDVVAWLGEALSNGSSLIVSDQGINQGETGEGTDFIVSLR